MQNSEFKISNIEENVINSANCLSLWCTPLSSQGVDHKEIAGLITFSSLLLILNTLCLIWCTFEVDKYVCSTSNRNVQIKIRGVDNKTL